MSLEELIEKYNISKYFAYHEAPRDKLVIEFGWIETENLSEQEDIVISCSKDNSFENNATTLNDYNIYFNRLTSLTPDEFIEKWEPSPRELEVFWKSKYPEAKEKQHEFVLKLAYLIRDGICFEMYKTSFEVFKLGEPNDECGSIQEESND